MRGEGSWFSSIHSVRLCPMPPVPELFCKYSPWLEDSIGKLLFVPFRSRAFCIPSHPDYFEISSKYSSSSFFLNHSHDFTYSFWNIKRFIFLAKCSTKKHWFSPIRHARCVHCLWNHMLSYLCLSWVIPTLSLCPACVKLMLGPKSLFTSRGHQMKGPFGEMV